MNRTILFSPVGGTDPISSTNCRDGSLLHICRVYSPDVVYLYMSQEILENQDKDNRYLYCLDKLGEMQQRKMEYHIIEKEKLKDVQDFDFFYYDFRKTILKILRDLDSTDTFLLNVSSGTPAMKSGLLVLATLGEFDCKIIQVITPQRGMNEHIHRDYDVETLWELNEDNQKNFENRCKEVACPTLSLIKQEEIIKKHLQAYDYAAAVEVASILPAHATDRYMPLLNMAQARILLGYNKAQKIEKQCGIHCFPVQSGNETKYFEYALNLDIKLRRKEYVDFIRGITPIIVDMLELIIKADMGINIDDYCTTVYGVRKWDRNKLAGTDILVALQKDFKNFDYKNVYSVHLVGIINELSSNTDLKKMVQDLRIVEEKIRNLAAHEIISITDETIKMKTGFTSKTIMDKLKKCFLYSGIKIKKEYWNSYDDMNTMIIAAMDDRLSV